MLSILCMPVQNTVKLLRIFEASGCHCERTFSKFSFESCRDFPCFYHVFGGIYHGFTGICRADSTTVLLGFRLVLLVVTMFLKWFCLVLPWLYMQNNPKRQQHYCKLKQDQSKTMQNLWKPG